MIRGIHHTSISTRNFERMLWFYRDLLGLRFVASYDWAGSEQSDAIVGLRNSAVRTALLNAGNAYVEIFEYLSPVGALPIANRPACDAGITHIGFDVIDVIGEYDRLLAEGIEFHSPPVQIGFFRTTYGRDPDGNIFELQELLGPDAPISLARLVEGIDSVTGS
jgi:glyoxylase I family protein